jgi:uncharacterized protein DUF6265
MTSLFLVLIALAQAPTIERLQWLQGCWRIESGQRIVEEQWMTPRGGTMLGMARTVNAGKLVEYELVVIRELDGRFAYEAHPSGQPSAVFPSREVGESAIVFENLEHDFPQRVGYRRDGSSLTAWIEGTVSGKLRRVEFPYVRADCPSR